MWAPERSRHKIVILAGTTALTLAIHYGWIVEPIFGHVHWFHLLHGRFCYIPIAIAAAWFGLRGGLYAATAISTLLLPYIFGRQAEGADFVGELIEIAVYYFIAVLIGALVDREFEATRRRQQAELQVERSQKLSLVGQMAASVAHEVKNPLASIKGAADILTDDKTARKDRVEFSGILQSEVRRIDATITEFLLFARPKETRLEKVGLSDIIRACVRQLSPQGDAAGVEIGAEIEDGVIVNGDGEKLQQMILNLMINALQASKRGDEIKIQLGRSGSAGVRLSVSDSGGGLTPEAIKRAFEPFFSTKASGTGLGLAIVKSIVDSHAGQVSLINNDPSGTKAIVDLPLWEGGDGLENSLSR